MGDRDAGWGSRPSWAFVPGFLLILFGVAGIAWPLIQAFGRLSRRVLSSSNILTFDMAIFIAIHAVIGFSGLVVLGVLRRKSKESASSMESVGASDRPPFLAEKRPHEKSQTSDDKDGDSGGAEGLVGGGEDEQSLPGDGIE